MQAKRMVAALAILMAASLVGKPTVDALGAKEGFAVGADVEVTAADYIQDGLIALWDGIENAGWGIHDDSAPVWKDLTGKHKSVDVSARLRWDDDGLVVNKAINTYINLTCLKNKYGHSNGPLTIEQVGEFTDNLDYSGFSIVQIRNSGDAEYGVSAGESISVPCTSRNVPRYGMGMQSCFPWPSGLFFEPRSSYDGMFNYSMTCDGTTFSIYKLGLPQVKHRECGPWSWYNQYNSLRFFWAANGGTTGTAKAYCVRLYDRELSDTEILYNHLVDKIRFGLED